MLELKKLTLDIAGLGIILYSPFAAVDIARGSNYLEEHYWDPSEVARHVREGTIVGFGTGSPGSYHVRVCAGEPTLALMARYPWRIRLALRVQDNTVCIRDLYDLTDWEPSCPVEQTLAVESGTYRVTVASRPPDFGVIGDHQEIVICLEPVVELPALTWEGVPLLGDE